MTIIFFGISYLLEDYMQSRWLYRWRYIARL